MFCMHDSSSSANAPSYLTSSAEKADRGSGVNHVSSRNTREDVAVRKIRGKGKGGGETEGKKAISSSRKRGGGGGGGVTGPRGVGKWMWWLGNGGLGRAWGLV